MIKEQHFEEEIFARMPAKLPRLLLGILSLFVVLGLIALAIGANGAHAQKTWGVFLVNFLVWSGIGQVGIVLSAILNVANGRWAGSVRRLAESLTAFLPISFILFLVLFLGRDSLFPWVHVPVPEKAAWLNVGFLFTRDALSLIALYGVSFLFLYYSLRRDVGWALERGIGLPGRLSRILTSNWRGLEVERQRVQRALSILSPIVLILYAYVFSLLAFDLIMSLSPTWYSNLFGVYFFMANLYVGLAAIAIIAIIARRYLRLEAYITAAQLHDLGKLIFGLAIFWAYLTFTQYLVIWYGNLPEETEFLILRTKEAPWASLAIVVGILCFVIPFVVLLGRQPKRHPSTLLGASLVIILGIWLERFLLVTPSLWHEEGLPLGVIEILVSLGFIAAVVLAVLWFLARFPAVSLADLAVPVDPYGQEHAEVPA